MANPICPKPSDSLSEWLNQANQLLPDSDSAKLDLEVLLCHILDRSRTFLYTWPETLLSDDQYQALVAGVAKRQQGQPIAHIVGYKEFWSLPLQVSDTTLIPRPDTETLIEWVLENFSGEEDTDVKKKAVDLGTGTGAIALALASEYPLWDVSGCDRVKEAVELAKINANALGLESVRFFESSWFDGFDSVADAGSYHLIISNPPYIRVADKHLSEGDVVFEPKSALVSGEDGLDDIRTIISGALHFLTGSGCLLIEHGYDQAEQVAQLFVDAGYVGVGSGQDYGGNDRFTFGWNATSR
ncbi:peptide chain release factor N(5)-glutamine methyltransferase [Litoribrevibacter euphylliae]|uniref:Release factor glutamine methyltransferase n=1 Tax=Litoribrevibacter euphylliae TaxID=1834034 RepID=A0ABV7HGZ7_9GAMM